MAVQFSIKDNNSWKALFFIIGSGQALFITSSQLVQFALIWFLTVQTGSASVLATTSLVGLFPGVILGVVIGTLVERWHIRKFMILADGLITTATIALLV
jgi:DHA3 family macrolide efflux protein-like MFS transporter